MTPQARTLVESLWEQLLDEPFDLRLLAERVIHDCGVDAGDRSANDIRQLFLGRLENRWCDVAFAFNEALACYQVYEISRAEFVCAIFMSLALAEAIKRGEVDVHNAFFQIQNL